MFTRKTKNHVAATVNELAVYIRENAPIKFGQLAVAKKIAPATLYGYIRLVLDLCEDITYHDGVFTCMTNNNEPAKEA